MGDCDEFYFQCFRWIGIWDVPGNKGIKARSHRGPSSRVRNFLDQRRTVHSSASSHAFPSCSGLSCGNSRQRIALLETCPDRVEEIKAIDFSEQSLVDPTTPDAEAEELLAEDLPLPEYASTSSLSLAQVRQSVLEHNLDPAGGSDSAANCSSSTWCRRSEVRSCHIRELFARLQQLLTNLEQGNPTSQDTFATGMRLPLATGGTLSVDTLSTKADAGTPGIVNDPWQANLNFSISQPLLRNAGVNANTASIRISKWNREIADARVKLAAIRILPMRTRRIGICMQVGENSRSANRTTSLQLRSMNRPSAVSQQ